MKSLLKSMVVLLLAATMVGAGVFAATNGVSQNTSSTVGFKATDVFVDIAATSTVGADQSYEGKTYEDFSKPGTKNPATWTIGEMKLDGATYTATVEFKFTNQGDVRTTIAITEPTLSENFSMLKKLKLGDAAATDLTNKPVELGYGESATFTYIISLTNLNKNVEALACDFAVNMTKTATAA